MAAAKSSTDLISGGSSQWARVDDGTVRGLLDQRDGGHDYRFITVNCGRVTLTGGVFDQTCYTGI